MTLRVLVAPDADMWQVLAMGDTAGSAGACGARPTRVVVAQARVAPQMRSR